jgi:hypothetical protein
VIYNYGTSLSQTKNDVAPDSNQKLVFTIGTGSSIQPNSVELEIPVSTQTGDLVTNVLLTDVPVTSSLGSLVNSRGAVQGSINYMTGLCEVTPETVYKQFITKFEAAVTYGTA